MKPQVEKTAFRTGFEAVSRLGHFSISTIRICFGFRIRNCGRLFPLALLLASWQISATAIAHTATIVPDGSANSSVAAISSADSTGCTSSEKEKNQPSRDSNNSPEPAGDIDESDGGSDDFERGPFYPQRSGRAAVLRHRS